jgi:outer membrane protein OmpA-like peptidoglycan-associated protein
MMTLAITLALVAGPLAAQEGQKWVGIVGGYDVQNDTDRGAKDNAILGLAGGTWFTSRWGAELSVLGTQLKAKTGSVSADEFHGHVSGLLNLNPGGSIWYPYLRAGVGGTQVDTPWSFSTGKTTRLSYHAGIGVQGHLSEAFLLGLEARAVRIETLKSYTETLGLVTLGYRFGSARKAAPAPAPAPEPVAPKVEPPPPPPPPPAPAPEPVAPKVEPPPPAKIVLDEAVLHFANGKNDLSAEGAEAVRKVAGSLKAYKGRYELVVSGHTSSLGKAAFNKALSKRRADAVAKVLVEAGIPQASIQTVGEGPDKPIADNKTKEGQARNRRVEIDVKVSDAQVETRKTETAVSGN